MDAAMGEGTLNELLDMMSNEELVTELGKRNLSTEGTRFELIQRLAKARYVELGFDWPGPEQEELAQGGTAPPKKPVDPPHHLEPKTKRTPPKPRHVTPKVDETTPWPETPMMTEKDTHRLLHGLKNASSKPPFPEAFGGVRSKNPAHKIHPEPQNNESPARSSTRLPESFGDLGQHYLGRPTTDRGGHAGPRSNMAPRYPDYQTPRDFNSSTEEDGQSDYARPRQRERTGRVDNSQRQKNLQNARIIESIKKWNIKFSGRASEDPENFLIRMEESMQVTNLSPEDFFTCLPFFFEGVALEWYRNSRDRLRNYEEFCRRFRKRFGPPDFQHALQDEVRRRTQGNGEPVLDYLTCMQALMNRLVPRWSEAQQVDIALRNMIPRMQLGLERGEYDSMEELEVAAQRRERYLRISKEYKAPPTPELSILPDLAYREAARKGLPHRLANLIVEENEVDLTPEEEFDEVDNTEDPEYLALLQRRPANRKAPTRNSRPQKPSAPEEVSDRCYNCAQPGHVSKNCQEESRVHCRSCGKVGCTRSTCPDCPATERSYCAQCGRRGVNVSSCKNCAGNESQGRPR